MGGLGSGSYYRFGSKDCTEDCLSLDVRRWWRDGWLKLGTAFTTTWRRSRRRAPPGFLHHGSGAWGNWCRKGPRSRTFLLLLGDQRTAKRTFPKRFP